MDVGKIYGKWEILVTQNGVVRLNFGKKGKGVPKKVHVDGVGETDFKISSEEITTATDEGLKELIKHEAEVPKELVTETCGGWCDLGFGRAAETKGPVVVGRAFVCEPSDYWLLSSCLIIADTGSLMEFRFTTCDNGICVAFQLLNCC
ncbi:metalloenzyme, LuxS/M16 peptidase-like protein [Artemisia annua]|uniref:Metalloenzyme, LuxS/M16 peptidase-like protein n=1 Tax=Artemisia annua TaxID=35608 RepID=A0A2U1N5N2_ARTAN|nr:metalloenzyme, LuxS/M16 peptidase-like protein [Artemisia annua]